MKWFISIGKGRIVSNTDPCGGGKKDETKVRFIDETKIDLRLEDEETGKSHSIK